MTCPIDICWIEGIYTYPGDQHEEELVVTNVTNSQRKKDKKVGSQQHAYVLSSSNQSKLINEKESSESSESSYFNNFIYSLQSMNSIISTRNSMISTQIDPSKKNDTTRSSNDNNNHKISEETKINNDSATISTESESITSYAEIIVPIAGPGAPISPSTITSYTGSRDSSTISTLKNSPWSTKLSPSPSPSPNPSSSLSPIPTEDKLSSSPPTRIIDISRNPNTNPTNQTKPLTANSSKTHNIVSPDKNNSNNNNNNNKSTIDFIPQKEQIDNFSSRSMDDARNDKDYATLYMSNTFPVQYIRVPQTTQGSNPSSPLRTNYSNGRPPISPKSREYQENAWSRIINDEACIASPPELNRFLPSDGFLFDRQQKKNTFAPVSSPTPVTAFVPAPVPTSVPTPESASVQVKDNTAESLNESIEVRISSNMSENQQIEVEAMQIQMEDNVDANVHTHAYTHVDEFNRCVQNDKQVPVITDFSLGVGTGSFHFDEDEKTESLIGDDLVLDEEMCNDQTDMDIYPIIYGDTSSQSEEEQMCGDKYQWEYSYTEKRI